MHKIFTALLMIVFIVLAAFTGCSYDGGNGSPTAPDEIVASESSGTIADGADEIDLKDIRYSGSELYIAITSAGTVLALDDALNRMEKQEETGIRLEAAAWGDGRVVAAGGEGMIITSEDGVNWMQKDTGTDADLYEVMWDGRQFIAVGRATLLTSPDGDAWLCRKVPEINPGNGTNDRISLFYGGIFWDGKQYFTGGSGNYILASEDLDQWTVVSGDSLGSGMYYGFAWNSSRYVAVGDHFEIITSEDGRNWTKEGLNIECRDRIDDYYTLCINSVVWGQEKFVAVGQRGLILVSDNGLDWSVIPPVTRLGLNRVIWDGRQYIAVGDKNTIVTSTNGIDWK